MGHVTTRARLKKRHAVYEKATDDEDYATRRLVKTTERKKIEIAGGRYTVAVDEHHKGKTDASAYY